MLPLKTLLAIGFGFGGGLWCAASAFRKTRQLNEARFWLATPGRILEARILRDAGNRRNHFRIRYEFTADERREGDSPRLCGHWFWSDRQQLRFAARFQPGQIVDVYYDPRDPRRNCLDRDDRSGVGALWVLAGGGPLLASLVLWLALP